MLVDTKAVLEQFSISRGTLTRWIRLGFFPKPLKIDRTIRFRKSDIDAFIASGGPTGSPRGMASFWAPDQDDVPPEQLGNENDIASGD